MTIEYWTSFSKRKNSTKTPASSGTSATVQLKEGTSIESPVFLLSGDLFTITYVNAFGHYYFVTDVRSVRNGLTEIYCKMDPLASHKSEIGSYKAFIERSSHTYDPWLPDPACICKPSEFLPSSDSVSSGLNSTGCFAVSVLNDIGSGTGFTCTYIMEKGHLELLAKYVNTDWGSAAVDIVGWLQSVFLKTASSIIDCIWLPVDYNDINITAETIKVGVDNVVISGFNVEGKRLTGPLVISKTANLTFPSPQAGYSNDFRALPPFCKYKIYIPGYGMMDINREDFSSASAVMDIDMATGDTMVYLKSSTTVVSTLHINLGVSCPVGKVGSDVTGTLLSSLGVAANLASAAVPGNRYADISRIEAVSSGISAMTSAFGITPSVSGSRGGRALITNGLNYTVVLFEYYSSSVDYDDTLGYLCMAEHQISTIPGYIKCNNASVPINGMDAERDEINSFLNSGFYYE